MAASLRRPTPSARRPPRSPAFIRRRTRARIRTRTRRILDTPIRTRTDADVGWMGAAKPTEGLGNGRPSPNRSVESHQLFQAADEFLLEGGVAALVDPALVGAVGVDHLEVAVQLGADAEDGGADL